ncbi:MAG: hypothetical protein ABI748_04950 [Dokdonella sp.]
MSARATLHLVALLAPFAAAALWVLLMYRSQSGVALRQFLLFGGLGALAAQVAAWLRWRALERRAREGHGAWHTGIGMAAITHLLFAVFGEALLVLAAGGWRSVAGTGRGSDIVLQMLFFLLISIFAVGAISFPSTAVLAQWIANLRRKELAHAAQ